MKSKIIMNSTTNRGEFNHAYKFYLEHKGKIHCCVCKYHRNENYTGKWYGSRKDEKLKLPNWKLVSKNPKQWIKKPIKKILTYYGGYRETYTAIKW